MTDSFGKSSCRAGKATLTIVVSRKAMNVAADVSSSVFPAVEGSAPGASVPEVTVDPSN